MRYSFPQDFVWGFSSSAYQIEGAWKEGGKGLSIWDSFAHKPGAIVHGDTGDIACDHYHRYESDIELMKDLGAQVYNYSLSWPRIQAGGTGKVLSHGLDFYKRLSDAVLAQGMQPWVTLYHWDLPQELQDKGGWNNPDTAKYFADYAMVVFQALGDRVERWFTHNEPWVVAYLGYWKGVHAPGITDLAQAVQASHVLLLSHGLAVQAFRSLNISSTIGIHPNLYPVTPHSSSAEDAMAAQRYFEFTNTWFLDPIFHGHYPELLLQYYETVNAAPQIAQNDMKIISSPIDFLGINYYSRYEVQFNPQSPLQVEELRVPGRERTAMDWEIYPQGLYEILMHLHTTYGKNTPQGSLDLFITENGIACSDFPTAEGLVHDPQRIDFYKKHCKAAHRAIQEGVPLKGFLFWTFMDNFEWAMGYSKRFGLVYVDFETQKRIPKDSAAFFADLAKSSSCTDT